jgi:adenylate cyclase
MLYELPLQFAAEKDTERLFDLILNRVMKLIPGAVRGALLIRDETKQSLAVRASVPETAPAISRTLILRAAQEQSGFIWGDKEDETEDFSASIASIRIRTGMFAPMLWKDETIGVLFVDNPERKEAFTDDDLRFFLSVAHYAASAVANRMLQNEIEENNRTLEHLLANFSPKIRRRLLEKSRAGRLQPGGEKSDVTILLSDLRGFTRTTAKMDSQDVVEMLNDYFHELGQQIFRHDGTIDKYIGDAILAVFGSPEPDPDHAHKATLAALDMQRRMAVVNSRRSAMGLPVCELGIGVFTGEVLHGFIGSEDRLEYTVIGDTVNMAARYCDGAQGGQIVLGMRTYEMVAGRIPGQPHTIPTKHEGDWPGYLVDWLD